MNRRARIIRYLSWALVSVAFHLCVLLAPRTAPRRSAEQLQPAAAWLESVPAPAPDPPPPPPEPPLPVTQQAVSPAPKRATARRATPVPAPPIAASDAAEGIEVASAGEPAPATELGAPGGDGAPGGTAAGGGVAEPVAHRTAGAPQLSFWLNPAGLEQLALQRPSLTLLMAVPGYRDVFRGSTVRPFIDLSLLRVFLSGLTPRRLTVAGVHTRGETALRQAAERVAAMQSLELDWRGSSDLRATAWIDPSGIDRGLAVHEGAFLIGARESLPGMLGTADPGARVVHLSKLRQTVIAVWVVEDARVYLPRLAECGLQALHVSVADRTEGVRMTLTAHYGSSTLAADSGRCLGELPSAAAPRLISWLQAASGASGSYTRQLRAAVSRDDIERLFDEISAALRRAARA